MFATIPQNGGGEIHKGASQKLLTEGDSLWKLAITIVKYKFLHGGALEQLLMHQELHQKVITLFLMH